MRPDLRDDAGLTLVELLVASALLALVLAVGGALLIGAAAAQRTVSSLTDPASAGQALVAQLDRGIRNATAFRLEDRDEGQLLVARVLSGADAGAALCHAWHYESATGTVRSAVSAGAIDWPADDELAGWTVAATGVSPVAGSDVFADEVTRLRVEFAIAVPGERATRFRTAIVPSPAPKESAPCF